MQNMSAPVNPIADERLHARLSEALKGIAPGASLALWTGEDVRSAACGWANIEADISADTQTIFQIGSITKVFTATLMMIMRDEGQVDLDAPVRQYLPEFEIASAPPPPELTVRTLLDYTSGIAGEYFEDFGPGPDALARYVEACRPLPLLFRPGTMRAYSSTAYCVAGRLIEKLTGQCFDVTLEERLLRPLGMERFAFYNHDIARYRTAIGYECQAAGGFAAMKALRLPHAMSASGSSLTTTATDLLKFSLLHKRGGIALDGSRLLQQESCDAMIEGRRRLPPGDTPILIGWAAMPLGDGRLIVASGQTSGQNAVVAFAENADFALAILSNAAGAAQSLLFSLGAELMEESVGVRPAFPGISVDAGAPAADLERYCGPYTNHTRALVRSLGARLELTLTAKETTSRRIVSQAIFLSPVGGHRFVAGSVGSPTAVVEFLFTESAAAATHFSFGGSIFARCDADGKTDLSA